MKLLALPFLVLFILASCDNKTNAEVEKGTINATTEKAEPRNYLSMKLNGVEWKADHEIFGAFHPEGYNKAIKLQL